MSARGVVIATTLEAGNGGIARVARLMIRALRQPGGLGCDAISYLDRAEAVQELMPVRCYRGRRVGLAWTVARAQLRRDLLLFDSLGMARLYQSWLGKSPALAWFHGVDAWEQAAPHRITTARKIPMLVCNSEYTRARAERVHGGFARAHVCWLATEEDGAPPSRLPLSGPPTALIVGRMDELSYKGHRELITCWPRVREAVPDAMLQIAGRGPRLETYRQLAKDVGVAKCVQFLGFVPEQDLAGLYRGADVLAMPSRGEGFGLVYIEAMRHAVPVIASIHDAGSEVNIDAVTGFNVNLDRPNELADRIIDLLRDRGGAQRMGEAGQKRWAEHFRFSGFATRFLAIVDKLRS